MARLIDAETLEHELCVSCASSGLDYPCSGCWVIDAIHRHPTIEAQPVRQGRWQYDLPNAIFVCSECKMMYRDNPNFCPRCGAKMDGEEAKDETTE